MGREARKAPAPGKLGLEANSKVVGGGIPGRIPGGLHCWLAVGQRCRRAPRHLLTRSRGQYWPNQSGEAGSIAVKQYVLKSAIELRSTKPRRLSGPGSSSIASHRTSILPMTALTRASNSRSRSVICDGAEAP
jgi:hypothetical protein